MLDLCALKECSWILSMSLSWFVLPMDVTENDGIECLLPPRAFPAFIFSALNLLWEWVLQGWWSALCLVFDLFYGPVSTWQLRGIRRTVSPEFTNIWFAKSFTRPSWRMCNNVESISFAGVKILIFINCLFYTFILGMSACLSCIILLIVKAGK